MGLDFFYGKSCAFWSSETFLRFDPALMVCEIFKVKLRQFPLFWVFLLNRCQQLLFSIGFSNFWSFWLNLKPQLYTVIHLKLKNWAEILKEWGKWSSLTLVISHTIRTESNLKTVLDDQNAQVRKSRPIYSKTTE